MNWIADRTVVVPIDMSDFSLKALDAACRMADDPQRIRVLHVLPTLEPAEPGIVWNTLDDGTRIGQAKTALAAFLRERGYPDTDITVRIGDPGTQIAMFADDIGAGLIVIPSHGRGMLTRMLLGSTTDRVVHLAQCPVLILKERKADKGTAKNTDTKPSKEHP